jgi:hypothetical protein
MCEAWPDPWFTDQAMCVSHGLSHDSQIGLLTMWDAESLVPLDRHFEKAR